MWSWRLSGVFWPFANHDVILWLIYIVNRAVLRETVSQAWNENEMIVRFVWHNIKIESPSFGSIKVLPQKGNCTCSKLKDCTHLALNRQSSDIRWNRLHKLQHKNKHFSFHPLDSSHYSSSLFKSQGWLSQLQGMLVLQRVCIPCLVTELHRQYNFSLTLPWMCRCQAGARQSASWGMQAQKCHFHSCRDEREKRRRRRVEGTGRVGGWVAGRGLGTTV